jgi:hypothetical protein
MVRTVVLTVLVAGLVWVSEASAVFRHIPTGTVSYQPLRGQATHFDAVFSNLEYSGGPVMASNTNYTFYWSPSGLPAYPAGYTSGVNQYLTDLGHDRGGHQNVDSVSAQYGDSSGRFSAYSSYFKGQIIDTDPYPANGCPVVAPTTHCITDAQIQAEFGKYLNAHGLPRDLTHEYFLLTPPNVESCFDNDPNDPNGPYGGCSAGEAVNPVYCAYHFNGTASPVFVYAVDMYVTGNPGCDDGNHPNGPSDGVLEGGLSHEHNESITDPLPNSSWTDIGGTGGEVGDKCDANMGTPLGVHNGASYNQVINGHFYWYQEEYSNQGRQCLQRFTLSGALPAVQFTATGQAGDSNTFTASAAKGVTEFNWQWNDSPGLNNPGELSTPTTSHTFPTSNPYIVGLTVYKADGTSNATGGVVSPGHTGLLPGITISPASPRPGQTITFHGLASIDGVPVQDYSWDLGDGSVASGSSPTHVYLVGKTYSVRLTMFWAQGQFSAAAGLVSVKLAVRNSTATTASAPSTGTRGVPIPAASIGATVSGATSTATGAVSFRVFGPQSNAPTSCSTGGVSLGTANVAGDGTYHPGTGYRPASAGKYWWYTQYAGDGANGPSHSPCGTGMTSTTAS